MDFAALFALLIALLCVNRVFNISASSVVNCIICFPNCWSIIHAYRTFTQVENEMNSAERLHTYAQNLPKELLMSLPKILHQIGPTELLN